MTSNESYAATASSNTAITSQSQNAVTTYHGQNSNGSFRVARNGIKANVYGTLSLRYTKEQNPEKPSLRLRKIATTPGYENVQGDGIISFIALCPTSQKCYRIKGKVVKCAPKIKAVAVGEVPLDKLAPSHDRPIASAATVGNTLDTDLELPASPIETSMQQALSSSPLETCTAADQQSMLEKMQATKERKDAAFQTELANVSAQRAAGFDPLVSVHFATKYLNRSRASMYRDLANAVLASIKVGHSTRLLFSTLEALKTGTNSV